MKKELKISIEPTSEGIKTVYFGARIPLATKQQYDKLREHYKIIR